MSKFGAIVPLDIQNAFPSLAQAFLFLVLRMAGLYEGLLNVTRGCYEHAAAFAHLPGTPKTFLFMLASGIMQGCPLSGSMFALAFDPFLRDLYSRVDALGLGTTSACADDVVVTLHAGSLAPLLDIDTVFGHAAGLAHLHLKLAKTQIIPFGGGGFPISLRRRYPIWRRRLLAELIFTEFII